MISPSSCRALPKAGTQEKSAQLKWFRILNERLPGKHHWTRNAFNFREPEIFYKLRATLIWFQDDIWGGGDRTFLLARKGHTAQTGKLSTPVLPNIRLLLALKVRRKDC